MVFASATAVQYVLSAPMSVTHPSTLALQSLESIPQSAAPSPRLPEEGTDPPTLLLLNDSDPGPSRPAPHRQPSGPQRSSLSLHPRISGSYFADLSNRNIPSNEPLSTEDATPSSRVRPHPISIPVGTPDEPLFSAYPPNRSDSKSKGRSFAFPLESAFQLSTPPVRTVKLKEEPETPRDGAEYQPEPAAIMHVRTALKPKMSRRRAVSLSHPLSMPGRLATEERPGSNLIQISRLAAVTSTKPLKILRRRHLSLSSAPHEAEFQTQDGGPHWPSMASHEARRFNPSSSQLSFNYQQPADSEYTLQSISTVATVRPLSSPTISPRRSSLVDPPEGYAHFGGSVLLGLSQISASPSGSVEIFIPEDDNIPHQPPPRQSSLDFDVSPVIEIKLGPSVESVSAPTRTDRHSILSASLTGTDTSASIDEFTTSPSSKEHPLSSATTSLSRSAKSGREDKEDRDASLSAVRLQRSLEWEAKQTRHRRGLEKRRLILLELVETEVAYTEDLKTLVQVYLPQLYALPSVSERTADHVARNSAGLLDFHSGFAGKMVDVLKDEDFGYEQQPEPVAGSQLERVSRRLSELFVSEVSGFSGYQEYCAGSIAAATLVRYISQRADYDSYERRCQIISSRQPHATLQSLLADDPPSTLATNRNRLHFRDFLIMPIQRICRYPLLLNQLLGSAASPSPTAEMPQFDSFEGVYDVGVDIERALGTMRAMAEEADEARRLKEAEIKSATILERLEPHQHLTPDFLKTLGTCRLIGSLDVLHHHPVVAPLLPPVKVKYLAAFLYRGYLVLAKVKKGKVYEAKHYLPLEVFELIDIAEGFLPHSIRLSLRDHSFDLAASCETEKEVWAAAICQARDESSISPFELPASVSPFAARTRRMSVVVPPGDFGPPISSSPTSDQKRHSLTGVPADYSVHNCAQDPLAVAVSTSLASPTRTSFGSTSDRVSGQQTTISLRRASATQRLLVDRGLLDVFSESCSTARSRAQLQHALFQPGGPAQARERLSLRDSTMLRRRRSFLDHHRAHSLDITVTGEIKGSIIPIRYSRSFAGKRRMVPPQATTRAEESSTEMEGDETVTSDYGTTTRPDFPVSDSVRSESPAPSPRRSFQDLRRLSQLSSAGSLSGLITINRRKTASSANLKARPPISFRAKSTPVSPILSPVEPFPPSLKQSVSDTGSTRRRTDSTGYFDTRLAPSESGSPPIFALGQGVTNQPDRPASGSLGASLRRSMSFITQSSIKRNPSITFEELPNGAGNPASDRDFSPQAKSRGSSDALTMSSSSKAVSTPDILEQDDEVDTASPVGTPKRKRSSRLFHSLSRFTPFE